MEPNNLITFYDLEKRGIPTPRQNRKLWLSSSDIAELGIASTPTILKWMKAGILGEFLFYKNYYYIHVNNIDTAKEKISKYIRNEALNNE